MHIADERRQFAAPASVPVPAPTSVPAVAGEAPPPAVTPARLPVPSLIPSLSGLPSSLRRAFDGEIDRGNAVLFAPVFMAAGALAYFALREEPAFAPLLVSFALAVGLSAAASARPVPRAALLAAAMVFAGMLAGKVETWRAATPMLGAEITTRLTARVVRVERQATGRVRLTLDVLATERPTLRHAPRRVRATARAVPEGLAPGDAVRGIARLMPPSGPVRPASYDFAFESYFSGIGAVGFFLSGLERMAADPPPGLRARLAASMESWRGRVAARIERRIGGPEGAVAAALITGVRAGIPEEINEALRVAGLYHVISISGLHMALVAGTLMVSLRAAFALAPSFSMRRPVKKYAAAFALAATGFYLIMSGGDVAARRSFIMLAVMLLAVIFDRAALTMRNLALSALIILALSPHEVVGPSFQMSFAATAALVAAYAAWRDRRARRPARARAAASLPAAALRRAAAATAGLAMTSVVAGIATALFTAWHFQQVSPLGLVANLAAMPVVSVVVMPMAVLAALAMPFGLDGPPLWLMGQGIAAMNAIALWLAGHSAFDATGAIPLAAVLVLTAALAVLTMAESALRWTSLPLVVLGVALIAVRDLPDAFVAEDASLVALRLADGRIAVNRARPRAFTIDNWQRAFGGGEIVRPRDGDAGRAGSSPREIARDKDPSSRPGPRPGPEHESRPVPAADQGRRGEEATGGAGARQAAGPIASPPEGVGTRAAADLIAPSTDSGGSGRSRVLRADDNATVPPPITEGSITGSAARPGNDIARPAAEIGFSCADGLCVARRADGAVIVHAANAAAAAAACGDASLIVIADATASNPCAAGEVTVLTARDLARRGSAEIAFPGRDDRRHRPGNRPGRDIAAPPPRAVVRFAVTEPYRPWHEHRRYSREARGLAPYQPLRRPSSRRQSSPQHPPPSHDASLSGADLPDMGSSGMSPPGTNPPGAETGTPVEAQD